MKRFFPMAIALLVVGACQKIGTESQEPIDPQVDNTSARTITVLAGEAGTRTEISEVETGDATSYVLSWSAGDQIDLVEWIYGNRGSDKYWSGYSSSDGLYADDYSTASFSVDLPARANVNNDKYRYVAVYPSNCIYSADNWTGDSPEGWQEIWGASGQQYEDHAYLVIGMPTSQYPTASSFDPSADVLVSEMITQQDRATSSLSLNFARVGTIVKMTLGGLPAGARVNSGQFKFNPDEWIGNYLVQYDPLLRQVGYSGKSAGIMDFYPKNVYVYEDGTADIWLRVLSGQLTTWFDVDEVDVTVSGQHQYYKRHIDLSSLNRRLTFAEGGLTKFSVTLKRFYTLSYYSGSSTVTETSIEGHMWYNTGGAPLEGTEYGLLKVNGSDVSGTLYETARAEDIFPMTVSNTSGNEYVYLDYLIEDLSPDTDYRFRVYMKLEDGTVCYEENGGSLMFHTKEHITYIEPDLIDLGLPSGTKWGSFNLGSTSTLAAGRFFAWGETVAGDAARFKNYRNQYWIFTFWDNTSRYVADKYSTDLRNAASLDFKTELEPEDDAATVNLGEGWRTPSYYDFKELVDNCTETINSDGSVTYTSNINSASITLPACGYYLYRGSGDGYQSIFSYYMTSSLYIPSSSSSALSDSYGFRNQPLLFWKGFNEKATFSFPTYPYLMYRSGFYNIRPVYGGNPDKVIPMVRITEEPEYCNWDQSNRYLRIRATFVNLDPNANLINDYQVYARLLYGESGRTVSTDFGYVTSGSAVSLPVSDSILNSSSINHIYYQVYLRDNRTDTYYFSEVREIEPPTGD